MSKHELPVKYIEAEEWANHFLKRIKALRQRYQKDDEFREYFKVLGGAENASVKRTSMELTKALARLRKPL